MKKEKSDLLMGCFLYVFFLLSSQVRLSSVSVLFDFNDLPNDIAPVSPTLFPIDVMRKGRMIC